MNRPVLGESGESAPLFEIFSSIQGEATHVGERHLFVRLAGCDLECVFCDTPASYKVPDRTRLYLPDGLEKIDNPLSRDVLDDAVARLDAASGPHHMISVTGGEPLLYAEFLRPLFERWRGRGQAILLETGGHRPADLARVIDCVDVVMVDAKIASSAGFATPDDVQERFLGLASRVDCAVKVVFSADTTEDEVAHVADLVAACAPAAPLILQPVSGTKFKPPSGEHALALQRVAMARHRDTRVIVQTHRILHLR